MPQTLYLAPHQSASLGSGPLYQELQPVSFDSVDTSPPPLNEQQALFLRRYGNDEIKVKGPIINSSQSIVLDLMAQGHTKAEISAGYGEAAANDADVVLRELGVKTSAAAVRKGIEWGYVSVTHDVTPLAESLTPQEIDALESVSSPDCTSRDTRGMLRGDALQTALSKLQAKTPAHGIYRAFALGILQPTEYLLDMSLQDKAQLSLNKKHSFLVIAASLGTENNL